jgi:hypothetical protein
MKDDGWGRIGGGRAVRCGQREALWFLGGALLGVVAMVLVAPESRRQVWRRLESWLGEGEGPLLDEIEQEAAATEGGLAGTRAWRQATSVHS